MSRVEIGSKTQIPEGIRLDGIANMSVETVFKDSLYLGITKLLAGFADSLALVYNIDPVDRRTSVIFEDKISMGYLHSCFYTSYDRYTCSASFW